jgi:hypothetical protein
MLFSSRKKDGSDVRQKDESRLIDITETDHKFHP